LYTPFQLAKKYINYYLTASNGKGHGVHSPFVFNFIEKVLNKKGTDLAGFDGLVIEEIRKELLADERVIEVEDFGAGSGIIKTNKRVVKKIAATSLKPKKYAKLLESIVNYYEPEIIIELGTSLGITTSYLATPYANSTVYTFEGASNIASIAKQTFDRLELNNIKLICGDFTETLSPTLEKLQKIDLAFVDGNHKKEPTVNYFHQLLQHSTNNTILIFDDIHWSAEMEAAWEEIKNHSSVTLTIDLFFIGLVFINTNFKEKQHFTIHF
jgi:predicted O-methyltransferase YrrM